MRRFYLVSAAVVLGLTAAGAITGGGLEYFLSVPSLIVVIVPPLILSVAHFSVREIRSAYSVAFLEGVPRDTAARRAELKRAATYHRTLGIYLIVSGILGTLLGLIVLLANLTNDIETVGAGFSVSLVTVFYSVVLVLVFVVPFRAAIARQLADLDEAGALCSGEGSTPGLQDASPLTLFSTRGRGSSGERPCRRLPGTDR